MSVGYPSATIAYVPDPNAQGNLVVSFDWGAAGITKKDRDDDQKRRPRRTNRYTRLSAEQVKEALK